MTFRFPHPALFDTNRLYEWTFRISRFPPFMLFFSDIFLFVKLSSLLFYNFWANFKITINFLKILTSSLQNEVQSVLHDGCNASIYANSQCQEISFKKSSILKNNIFAIGGKESRIATAEKTCKPQTRPRNQWMNHEIIFSQKNASCFSKSNSQTHLTFFDFSILKKNNETWVHMSAARFLLLSVGLGQSYSFSVNLIKCHHFK